MQSEELRTVAALCAHAYAPGDPPPAGVEHLHAAELFGRIQFSLYRQGAMLIIAWAGSNEPHDWLRHTMARRKRVPGHMLPPECPPGPYTAHRGWLADADACLPTLTMLLHTQSAGSKRIIFGGHSYGGPLAIIAAVALLDRIRQHHRLELGLVTCGSPAPGNAAYAAIVDAAIPSHIRACNPLDIVTRLPGGLYAHPGQPLPIPAGWPAHSIHRYRDWIEAQAAGPGSPASDTVRQVGPV